MTDILTSIQETRLRDTVEIILPDGRVFSGPRNTPVGDFLRLLPDWSEPQVVGAIINGELRELTYKITMDAKVKPIDMSSADGARIYRRSITFLLEAAFEDLFPLASMAIDHSVSSGGYYCTVTGFNPLTQELLDQLANKMLSMVEADQPFERRIVPISEAIEVFTQKGYADKVQLLKYRQKDTLVLYSLGDHQDYLHGYMVPSTGYLKRFGLKLLGDGFVIIYPRRHMPGNLLPMPDYPKLLRTFRQYGNWLSRLGIENVGALNDAISGGRIREIILVSEALHEQKIADIARQVADRSNATRIVLIAGPSSSGKTTFSKRLSVQLLAQGCSPFPLELDNYFVDRERTPRDEDGQLDYETLLALDIERLERDLLALIAGGEVQLPRYDFKTGKSSPGEVVKLGKDQLILLEGIHGLNPGLLPNVPQKTTFRLYVSCLTQLNLDRHNRISTTDTRLLRRIVRDQRERGYSALDTIGRWESVRRGEKRHIFPFQENADEVFNSALVYELSALRERVEPLLRQVPFGTNEFIEAKRLLAFLEWFMPIDAHLIPDNSILREFLGDSSLKEFKLWDHTNNH
ncbi:MAG TPA: nucleoside kinase [Anaerolineaceae bacterium]|nr:nucleoside kinase [Anaerolineaceae bacterium]